MSECITASRRRSKSLTPRSHSQSRSLIVQVNFGHRSTDFTSCQLARLQYTHRERGGTCRPLCTLDFNCTPAATATAAQSAIPSIITQAKVFSKCQHVTQSCLLYIVSYIYRTWYAERVRTRPCPSSKPTKQAKQSGQWPGQAIPFQALGRRNEWSRIRYQSK